ncbi:MAG: metallophosphoesterase, partial [Bacillota bacterium]|nr:metallophosphoesterase [Bacillota bacterium]
MDPTIEDKSMDMFGGVWVDHARRLEEIWNRLVEPEDTVLIPGDISWALKLEEVKADFEFLKTLPGKKIIMKGNHDLWWSSKKKMEAAFPEVFFLQNNCYVDENYVLAGSRGWLDPNDTNFNEETDRPIYSRELLRIRSSLEQAQDAACGRSIIAATHFPPVLDNGQATEISKLFSEFNV